MSVKKALDALGKNQESVSAKLREMKITGTKQELGRCPIANYLKESGLNHVLVRSDSFTHFISEGEEGEYLTELLPSQVYHWIRAFDAGTLPEFEDPVESQ